MRHGVGIVLDKHKGETQECAVEWEKEAPFDRSLGEGHASLTGAKEACSKAGSLTEPDCHVTVM